MLRGLLSVLLLGMSASAIADDPLPPHFAKLSTDDIKAECAERATNLGARSELARRAGGTLAPTEITDADLIVDRLCQIRLQRARLIALMRAKVDADQAHVDRLLGRLAPGQGYHIVWLPHGVEHSPRAVYYLNGRARTVNGATVDAATRP